MKKAQETKKVSETKYEISNCTVNNGPNVNEHTCAAIVALARAIEANAMAVAEASKALKGGDALIGNVFRMGPGTDKEERGTNEQS